jgi:8-oxo-dGTP pyrophosphatase MutT (NUDIX family)
MGEGIVRRLEQYFRLSPSPGGLITPPDPQDRIILPDHLTARQERHAAVLIPIFTDADGRNARIMLTRRTEHLRRHAGQISLPGGSVDPGDRDIIHTALREAEEETCLKPESVTIAGTLPALIMPTAYHVTPVVGLIRGEVSVTPCPNEVAEIFFVPADILLDPARYQISSMTFQNRRRKFREVHYEHYRIWGATAAILHHLAEQLTTPGAETL